jgi:hypothetical protein
MGVMLGGASCAGGGGGGSDAGDAGNDSGAATAIKKRAPAQGNFPIEAMFVPAEFATTYQVNIDNPDRDNLTYRWSGPNCGTWEPQGDQSLTSGALSVTSVMKWVHPHPPCDPTTEHKDVLVTFSVTGESSGVTLICTYEGAADGVGPACQKL